jgi:hypothetical protein
MGSAGDRDLYMVQKDRYRVHEFNEQDPLLVASRLVSNALCVHVPQDPRHPFSVVYMFLLNRESFIAYPAT